MQLVSSTNPLMDPIQHNGQIYFTSQYFHHQYRSNSGDTGKYEQLKHFNRLIRSIEAYSSYIDRGDIVELTREKAGPEFGPAFKAAFGNPLMLINATAQVALTHHLDDEISKQVSVQANNAVATDAPPLNNEPTAITEISLEDLNNNYKQRIELASTAGLDIEEARKAANDWTRRQDGVDILSELGVSQSNSKLHMSEKPKKELVATELGTFADLPGTGRGKGINANLALWALGYLDDALDSHGQPIWKISQQGLDSGLLYYAKPYIQRTQKGETEKVVYRPELIAVLKNTGLTQQDYRDLKADRVRRPLLTTVK